MPPLSSISGRRAMRSGGPSEPRPKSRSTARRSTDAERTADSQILHLTGDRRTDRYLLALARLLAEIAIGFATLQDDTPRQGPSTSNKLGKSLRSPVVVTTLDASNSQDQPRTVARDARLRPTSCGDGSMPIPEDGGGHQ
jgi:hypothetical protein